MDRPTLKARASRIAASDRGWWQLGSAILGLLCFSGQLKTVSLGPLDLTVVSAIALILVVFRTWERSQRLEGSAAAYLWLLFLLFAVPVLWTDWFQYSYEKVPRLFSLTLLSAFGGLYFLGSHRGRRVFVVAVTVIASAAAISAFLSIVNRSADLRVTGASASQIATGNAFGIVTLAMLAAVAVSRSIVSRSAAAAMLPLLCVGLVASGARSALAATLVAALVLGAVLGGPEARLRLAVGVGAAIAGGGALVFIFARDLPFSSVLRVIEFLQGQTGDGGDARLDYISKCLASIPFHPWGTGWGGFALLLEGTTERAFPHNLALEIALEAGWIAGATFVLMLGISVARVTRAARLSRSWTSLVFATFVIFAVVSSFVTGEINDSRWLFALVFGALTIRSHTARDARAALSSHSDERPA